MEKEIFKEKFISYMCGKSNCTHEHASFEYYAIEKDIDYHIDHPHALADDCMDCWSE